MQGVMLFSEINPRSQHVFDMTKQLENWHGFPGNASEVMPATFAKVVHLGVKHAVAQGQAAVIRDWSYADFIAKPFLEQPTHEFTLLSELPKHYVVRSVALVRHPIDHLILMSRQASDPQVGLQVMAEAILTFAQQSESLEQLKIESFHHDAVGFIKRCCELLRIDFDEHCFGRWQTQKKITGNFKVERENLAYNRVLNSRLVARLAKLSCLREACEVLGYEVPDWMHALNGASSRKVNGASSDTSLDHLVKNAKYEEAIVEFRRLELLRQLNAAELGNFAICLLRTGLAREAEEILAELLHREEQVPFLLRLIVECYEKLEEESKELNYRRELASHAPRDTGNLFRLTCLASKAGHLDESLQYARQILAIQPENRNVRSSYLMNLLYSDQAEATTISSEHFRLGMKCRHPKAPANAADRTPGPLRVGFVSRDFAEHPVGKIAIPIVSRLACHGVLVYIYHDTDRFDHRTSALHESVTEFKQVNGMSDQDLNA